MKWLAVLDMDGTILEQRTIDVLCEKLGLIKELEEIDQNSDEMDGHKVTSAIAKLFSGYKASQLEIIFDTIPFVRGISQFVNFLKLRNFVTSIITDSYTFLASRTAQKLGIDTVKGNQLEIINGVITGKISMPLGWEKLDVQNCHRKAVCKLNALRELAKQYSISENRILAIGDSGSDSCMVRKASIGVAFRPKDDIIVEAADVVIRTDFLDLKGSLEHFLDRLAS